MEASNRKRASNSVFVSRFCSKALQKVREAAINWSKSSHIRPEQSKRVNRCVCKPNRTFVRLGKMLFKSDTGSRKPTKSRTGGTNRGPVGSDLAVDYQRTNGRQNDYEDWKCMWKSYDKVECRPHRNVALCRGRWQACWKARIRRAGNAWERWITTLIVWSTSLAIGKCMVVNLLNHYQTPYS